MAVWAKCRQATGRLLTMAVLIAGFGLSGCGDKADPAGEVGVAPSQSGQPKGGSSPGAASTASAEQPAVAEAPLPPPPQDGRHQPFAKATRAGDDPPPECNRPPDVTVTGKPVFKLYSEVVRLWDTVRYAAPDGKRITYSATIETDLGNIEIALRSDLAPNHVRNFVALAKAGYYEGLSFDRIRHDQSEEQPGKVLDTIEAGCPLGTGEVGSGSIGYWLNPEFPRPEDKVTHEPGTVGACRGMEPDTAACRFYITLCDAPFLDGSYTVFGKVTQGLDVARKIYLQPVIEDDQDIDGNRRPEKPVKINKVTIHTVMAEAGR
jgi:peptidyl-prolyl cis-trans isomerase B (cyclophilin B)